MRGVLSDSLYQRIQGFGGFRNILVHGYIHIDPVRVHERFQKALDPFPKFAVEVLSWLDSVTDPPRPPA